MAEYLIAALAVFAALPSTALAQTKPVAIEVEADEAFRHKHSRLGFPPVLAAMPRTRVTDGAPDQYDVAINYALPNDELLLTFYVYRQVSGALPIWFDRAQWAIETRDIYGRATRAVLPPAFTPPGQPQASALAAAYALDDSPFRSTAVALVPLGEWLVKVRMSSKTHDPAALDAVLKSVLADLDRPRRITPAPVSALVEPCADALAFAPATTDVADQQTAMMNALLGGMFAGALDKEPDAETAPTIWCRDAAAAGAGAVYRAGGEQTGYLLAYSDAGRAVRVQPNLADAIMAAQPDAREKTKSWSVDFLDLTRTLSFRAQDGLPSPERVGQILAGAPVSTTATAGDKREISIDSGVFEKQ